MNRNKKGQLAGNTIAGIIGLVFLVVIGYVLVAQLLGANLLTAGSIEANSATNLSSNLTSGVNKLALQIPTFFVIIAAVLIVGFVLILWRQYQASKITGGSGQL